MKKQFIFVLILPAFLIAQSSWKREKTIIIPPPELFHSSQTANLPTTATLKQGNFFYEISHRFGRINAGYDALYGLDGPVRMRTALSYGLTDDLMLSIGRSNLQDNLDIRAKYKLFTTHNDKQPWAISVRAGLAFNTEAYAGVEKRKAFDGNSTQYYAQFIFNMMFLHKKLGFGIVPSYVYNSYIFANEFNNDKKYTFTLPTYSQYYISRMWSIWLEFSPVLSGWNGSIFSDPTKAHRSYNTLSMGFAIETGGHVFNLFITNNTRLNPTQYLVGADNNTDSDAWHFAFGITREL